MAKEYTRRVNYTSLETLLMKECYKCNVPFKHNDIVTTVTVRVSKTGGYRSRIYHEDCWQKVLQ